MKDQFKIKILTDGTISVQTGSFGEETHVSADEFLSQLKELTGGEVKTAKRKNFDELSVSRVDGRMKVKVGGYKG